MALLPLGCWTAYYERAADPRGPSFGLGASFMSSQASTGTIRHPSINLPSYATLVTSGFLRYGFSDRISLGAQADWLPIVHSGEDNLLLRGSAKWRFTNNDAVKLYFGTALPSLRKNQLPIAGLSYLREVGDEDSPLRGTAIVTLGIPEGFAVAAVMHHELSKWLRLHGHLGIASIEGSLLFMPNIGIGFEVHVPEPEHPEEQPYE